MMVFKRKQIIILALILLIVVAGYLQYSYRQGNTSADSEGRLGKHYMSTMRYIMKGWPARSRPG